MTVPVAEMTYFDSIEHLTYCVVAATEYSDGSVGRRKVLYVDGNTREKEREERRVRNVKSLSRSRLVAISKARELLESRVLI